LDLIAFEVEKRSPRCLLFLAVEPDWLGADGVGVSVLLSGLRPAGVDRVVLLHLPPLLGARVHWSKVRVFRVAQLGFSIVIRRAPLLIGRTISVSVFEGVPIGVTALWPALRALTTAPLVLGCAWHLVGLCWDEMLVVDVARRIVSVGRLWVRYWVWIAVLHCWWLEVEWSVALNLINVFLSVWSGVALLPAGRGLGASSVSVPGGGAVCEVKIG